jgi:hypothetical protein
MKQWLVENWRGVSTLGFCVGAVAGFVFLVVAATQQSCATVQEYDPATGTLKESTKKVAPWKVDEHYEEMIKALKAGKKIKVIWVKKENPIAAWTLGAGMVIGGLLLVIGIGIIAFSQGARLWRGLLFCAAGIGCYITFYMIDKYLRWICLGFALMLVGGIVYFYMFAKDTTDKAIETNDLQKGGEWDDELAERARKLQGGLQDVISRRAKKVRARAGKVKAKAERLREKVN